MVSDPVSSPSRGVHIEYEHGLARHVRGEATDFAFECDQHIVSLTLAGHKGAEVRLSTDEARSYDVEAGTVHIIEAGIEIWKTWPGTYELVGFLLNRDTIERATHQSFRLRTRLDQDEPVIRNLLTLLRDESVAGRPRGDLFVEGLSTALAAHMAQFHSEGPPVPAIVYGGIAGFRMRRVADYVAARLHEPALTVADIAAIAGLSPSHFSASLRQTLGKAPYQYVLEERIKRAKLLLRDPFIPIGLVAFRCGFANAAHFAGAFRRACGVSPTAFRHKSVS